MEPKQPSKLTEIQVSQVQQQVLEDWFDAVFNSDLYPLFSEFVANLPKDTSRDVDVDDERNTEPQTIPQQQPPDNLFYDDILEFPENLRNAEPLEEEPISVQHLQSTLAPLQAPLGPLLGDDIHEYSLLRTNPVATTEPQPLPTRSHRQSKRPRLTVEEMTPYRNMLQSDAATLLRVPQSTLSKSWKDLTSTKWPGPSTTRDSMVAMQDRLQTLRMHLRDRDARMLRRDAAMQSSLSQILDAIDLHCRPRETRVECQNETPIRCTSRPSPVRNQDMEENPGVDVRTGDEC